MGSISLRFLLTPLRQKIIFLGSVSGVYHFGPSFLFFPLFAMWSLRNQRRRWQQTNLWKTTPQQLVSSVSLTKISTRMHGTFIGENTNITLKLAATCENDTDPRNDSESQGPWMPPQNGLSRQRPRCRTRNCEEVTDLDLSSKTLSRGGLQPGPQTHCSRGLARRNCEVRKADASHTGAMMRLGEPLIRQAS